MTVPHQAQALVIESSYFEVLSVDTRANQIEKVIAFV